MEDKRNQQKNILFVSGDNDRYSGAFLSMLRLISELKRKYHHNILVVLPKKGNGGELLQSEGIETFFVRSFLRSVPIRKGFEPLIEGAARTAVTKLNVPRLVKLIREHNIDLVHINVSDSFIGAYAAIKTGTPFIWHIREFLEEDHKRSLYRIDEAHRIMKKADRVITISNSLYSKYAAFIEKCKMSVVYNGIDPQRYRNDDHEPLKNEIVSFLMVGNISQGKGQLEAVNACIRLRESGYTNFILKLVGRVRDRDYLNALKSTISKARAEDYIIFCGSQTDTPAYYRECDIFLMCSKSEAFGRVTVEAMFSGCLVIGANSGGTKDLIRDGETGLLYASGNEDELLEKIRYALNHKDKIREIAKRGQQYMLKNMTAEKNAEKVNRIYMTVFSKYTGGGV